MEVGNERRGKKREKRKTRGKRIVLRALRHNTAWLASDKTKLVTAMLLPHFYLFYFIFFSVKKFRRGVGWEDVW